MMLKILKVGILQSMVTFSGVDQRYQELLYTSLVPKEQEDKCWTLFLI